MKGTKTPLEAWISQRKEMDISCANAQCSCFTKWKESPFSSSPLSAARFPATTHNNVTLPAIRNPWRHMLGPILALGREDFSGSTDQGIDTTPSTSDGNAAKGSGTTARGRRLLKVREEKRIREYERLHNYPAWAKVLEDGCKYDSELKAVLGDSIGNPELMRKRIEERVRKRGRDFTKSKSGSVVAFKVSFRDFNPLGSYIWFQLYGSPSDRDVDLLGSVIQAWYVMGRIGAFNSENLQLSNSSMEYDPLYDPDKGFKVMPSSFHDMSDVEFQDNWGRVWVDLGTADFFSIDVLLNCLTVLSSEYVGIQQVVFGGRLMGDWEDGMTSPEDGYKSFKI